MTAPSPRSLLAFAGLGVLVAASVTAVALGLAVVVRTGSARLANRVGALESEVSLLRRALERPDRRPVRSGDILNAPEVGYIQITDPEDLIQRTLIEGHPWEPHVLQLVRNYAKAGATVVDVGAYIGTHSLVLSRAVGPGGRVHAFEPNATSASQLRRNLRLNDVTNVIVVEKALGERAIKGFMRVVDSTNKGGASACTEAEIATGDRGCDDGSDPSAPFDMVRFDDLGIRDVALFKIDVEGAELSVLRGARESIVRDRPTILIEITTREAQAYLEELGYDVRNIETHNFLALPRKVR